MAESKSNIFGLIIAFTIPGVFALHSLTFYFDELDEVFSIFLTADSNVGLFLLILVMAIAASLILDSVRGLLYEKLILRSDKIDDKVTEAMSSDDSKLAFFRAAVDESYRYHQFSGAITLIIPIYAYGVLDEFDQMDNPIAIGAILILEVILIVSAISTYKKFINRANRIK